MSRLAAWVIVLLCAWRTAAQAVPLSSEWVLDHWGVDDGLPLGHLTDLAWAADGSLWIASYDGIAHFDGERFELYRRGTHPALPTNRFTHIGAARHVYAVSEAGDLVRLPDLHLDNAALPGRATGLFRVRDQLFVATPGALLRLDDAPTNIASLAPQAIINSVAQGSDGDLWLGTNHHGVLRVSRGVATTVLPPLAGDRVRRVLAVDAADVVWVGGGELVRIVGDDTTVIATASGRALNDVCLLTSGEGHVDVRDREGWWRIDGTVARLLVATDNARCTLATAPTTRWPWRLADKRLMLAGTALYTASHALETTLVDPAGDLWIATQGAGLFRVRPRLVDVVTAPASWTRRSVEAVMIDGDATYLGSIVEGLARIVGNTTTEVALPARADGQSTAVFGLVRTAAGIEVGTDVTTCRIAGDACAPVPEPWRGVEAPGVVAPLLVDRRGRIWSAGLPGWVRGRDGLVVRDGPTWHALTQGGQPIVGALAATEAADGEVFIATANGGVVRVASTGQATRFGRAQGLSSERVRSVFVEGRVAWVGTEDAGLCRWTLADDDIRCLDLGAGLFDDVVHAVVPDAFGRLWLSGNRGISWVMRDVVDAVLEGRAPSVLALSLDERDGLLNREANGGLPQSSTIDARGRLWFSTQDGAAVIDPARVPIPATPTVTFVAVRADGEAYEGGALPAQTRTLEIEWTAASLVHARDLRFRYRLGSGDWSPPTRERRASWLGFPAGSSTFEVQAGLAGRWGEVARVVIDRAHRFSETPWFMTSVLVGALALVAIGVVWWSRRQRYLRVALEAEIARRTADLATANRGLAQRGAEIAAQAARLAEVDRLRTRFVADLSHELRTPLALVVGPLDDLARRLQTTLGSDDARRLEVIRTNATRLEELHDQLLDVARLENREVPLRVKRRDLGAFVARVAERFRPSIERKDLTLDIDRPAAPVGLYFDADLLDKVVTNLLGNALKFTTRGVIRVQVSAPGDGEGFARVVVTDSGVGIAEGALSHVFERFYQVDHGDARRYEGVGIGLALVRDLVALHGGEVSVTSVLGQGSTFAFTLPLGSAHLALEDLDLRSDDAPVTAPPPETDADTGARPTVLVVEDHPEMRAFLADQLRERFEVHTVDGGAAALAHVRAHTTQAIVSDVMMPGMDGYTLCRALRDDAKLRRIPVMLVSAKASEDDRIAGLAVADDYMTKPVRPRELVARVARLVMRRQGTPAPVATIVPVAPAVEDVAVEPTLDDDIADVRTGELDPSDLRNLERIDRTITEHMSEEAFGIIELAAALGMSRRTLQREVRRLSGRAPSEHLRVRRMDEAKRLLTAGAFDTVSEVAAAVGLSPAYFSRLYAAWFGNPPSDDLR